MQQQVTLPAAQRASPAAAADAGGAIRPHPAHTVAPPAADDAMDADADVVGAGEGRSRQLGGTRAATQDMDAAQRARERQDAAREEAMRLCMEMFDEADDDGDGLIRGSKVAAYLHRIFPSNEIVLYFMQRFEFTSDSLLDFQAFANIMRAAQVAFERLQRARQQQRRQQQQESTTQMLQRFGQDDDDEGLLDDLIND